MTYADVFRQLRQAGRLEEQLLSAGDHRIVEVIASDFPDSRGVFFLRDVHPVMRHAVAKEEFDGFQRLLVVLSPVYTQPLEVRRHQQLAPALKGSPNTRAQGRLAHQHLTDSIGRDADSFHLGDSLAGGGRASPGEQINVTRELPTPVANQQGGLIRRDINNTNLAREDYVAVKRLGTRTEEVFACCERAACAELRTFLQLGSGENRKSNRVLHQVGMELIWSLVHLLFIYLIRKRF